MAYGADTLLRILALLYPEFCPVVLLNKIKGIFFCLLMATELAPRGKEVPVYSFVLVNSFPPPQKKKLNQIEFKSPQVIYARQPTNVLH